MILFKKGKTLNRYILESKKEGARIGWVPTMGALHKGHMSLVQAARAGCEQVVCSIFVNPTQFNDQNDFSRYPVTLEKDISLLEENGVDMLFLPSVEEIYPGGTEGLETYDLGTLDKILEGKFRPGHFQGVCRVMQRLLRVIAPDHLYMGLKDYQQCMVVEKLLALTGDPLQLHRCPTEREADGLAMSSRNLRLNQTERKRALAMYAALAHMKKNLGKGPLEGLISQARDIMTAQDFRIEYVTIADARTLEPCESWDGRQSLVGLAAAYQGDVRLIDNCLLTDKTD